MQSFVSKRLLGASDEKKPVQYESKTLLSGFAVSPSPFSISSCARMESRAPGSNRDSEVGSDGQVEEIVVTGSEIERDKRPGRQPPGGRYEPVPANEPEPVSQGVASPTMRARMSQHSASLQFDADAPPLPYASDEELWVISKPAPVVDPVADTSPGSGAMLATVDTTEVPLPLQHTAVTAAIKGYISTVNVRQQFTNPYDSKIEAVYLFPLPEKSAVSEFLMIIGDRKIRGILREKEEAKAIYDAARSQGYQASLLVQHRPNVFEQKVANIEPGKSIDVDIKYFHTLKYEDGWYSFVFPTVVGPRYNPPHSTDPIQALPRGSTGSTQTGVHYLRPDERSGHDLSIDVSIDAGVTLEGIRSTHEITTNRLDAERVDVQLERQTTIPNRDFKVDFRVAGTTMKSELLTYMDDSGQGYFTMMLYPPISTDVLKRKAMEMVFVIDASGSMSGVPLTQAKDAVRAALDQLQQSDTFQLIRFSDNASQFGNAPVLATLENKRRAKRWLDNLHGGGGTQMVEGVRTALDFPHDPSRLRFVSFMTDGYIGNEAEILAAIHERLGGSRIFSFGVGSSVNRYLMERMAQVGKGAVAYLGLNQSGYDVMQDFFDRISRPALTDIEIDWGGMAVSDVYPANPPDVFVGRPLVVTGSFAGAAGTVRVSGDSGGEKAVLSVDGGEQAGPELAKLWARMRIAELKDRQTILGDAGGELAASIRETALRFQLMSDYTSYVAVDSSVRTQGDHGTTVHQAVPVPAGVRYDTTVGKE